MSTRILSPRFALLALFGIFTVTSAQAQTATYSLLYSFCAQAGCADGNYPAAQIVQAADGNMYSTTEGGGPNADESDGGLGGTVFKLTPAGVESVLNGFCSGLSSNCAGGYFPVGGIVQGANGNFYGTTNSGGTGEQGTLFHISPAGALTTIYNLCTQAGSGTPCLDGGMPYAPMILGSDGNYYGTNQADGDFGYGIVYQLTPSGTFNIFHTFCNDSLLECADGTNPITPLIQATDGNYYGSTGGGGANGSGGTIYQITPAGKFTVIYAFCAKSSCTDGSEPRSLVEGEDGNLYGATYGGGAYSNGEFFKLTTAGALTVLYSFCENASSGCPDGQSGGYGLWAGSDGNFYGTTLNGGDPNASQGVLYKMTPAGAYTKLYTFCVDAVDSCPNGSAPEYAPTQASDGSLIGPAQNGGAHGVSNGAIYTAVLSPVLSAPVQLSLSSSTTSPGTAVTLTWKVLNAFSTTMQQCYAFIQGSPSGAGAWTGQQKGTYSSSTHQYAGSASINPSADGTFTYALTCGGVESGFATLTSASPKVGTTTTLAASPNPAGIGQTETLNATVKRASGTGTPTGSVTFTVGTTTIGTETLNGSGVATLSAPTTTQAPGSYPVVATYSGDSADDTSASSALTVVLDQAATTTTVTASPSTVTPPVNVTLTATVKRPSGYAGVPTGKVTFTTGTLTIGTATLDGSGIATYTAASSGVGAGTYAVKAAYSGDANDNTSSGTVTVTVN